MYAIEFQTKVKNGSIEIPAEYKDRIEGSVRVIVLIQDKPVSADVVEQLLANPLKLKNFKPFTREQIYERH